MLKTDTTYSDLIIYLPKFKKIDHGQFFRKYERMQGRIKI